MIYPYCDEDHFEDINRELAEMAQMDDIKIYIGSGEDFSKEFVYDPLSP